jgi:hypothetical protein
LLMIFEVILTLSYFLAYYLVYKALKKVPEEVYR